MTTESSPLLSNPSSSGAYYFLAASSPTADNEASYERLPQGTTEEEFMARPILMGNTSFSDRTTTRNPNPNLFDRIFGTHTSSGFPQPTQKQMPSSSRRQPNLTTTGVTTKSSKAAIKVEPKTFFANERTFLAWLHTSILLAGASIAITSFSEGSLLNQLYGIILLPVAITFLWYAMHQYGRRSKMIRTTAPGPYEDIVGPVVLAVVLILSIIAQFSIKLYTLM